MAPSSTTNTTAVPNVIEPAADFPPHHNEANPDQEQEVLGLPSSMEVDIPQSVEEPNFDAYVAALQLQDCDENQSGHNTEDSESDYFSD